MNLLGTKIVYMENNKQVHHFLDFITEDECNDAYLTICCLDWLLSEVFQKKIHLILLLSFYYRLYLFKMLVLLHCGVIGATTFTLV